MERINQKDQSRQEFSVVLDYEGDAEEDINPLHYELDLLRVIELGMRHLGFTPADIEVEKTTTTEGGH